MDICHLLFPLRGLKFLADFHRGLLDAASLDITLRFLSTSYGLLTSLVVSYVLIIRLSPDRLLTLASIRLNKEHSIMSLKTLFVKNSYTFFFEELKTTNLKFIINAPPKKTAESILNKKQKGWPLANDSNFYNC